MRLKLSLHATLLVTVFNLCGTASVHNHNHNHNHNHHHHQQQESEQAMLHASHRHESIDDAWLSHHVKDGEHQVSYDHEAILGSRQRINEFERLSPKEARAKLEELVVNEMDANKDGFVSKDELITWIKRSFKTLAAEDAKDSFNEEDVNKDGFVTWQEHIDVNYALDDDDDDDDRRHFHRQYSVEDIEMMKEDKLYWEAADRDQDDKLNEDEFVAFSAPEEFEWMYDAIYNVLLARKDKNKDGLINLNEFLLDDNGKEYSPTSEIYRSEKEHFENDYDRNGDGHLDKTEVLNWLLPNSHDSAVAEAEHLIEQSDLNGDGRLSIDEILANYELFVGSSSTGYGQNLDKDEL